MTSEFERRIAETLGRLDERTKAMQHDLDDVKEKLDNHVTVMNSAHVPKSKMQTAATPAGVAAAVIAVVETLRLIFGPTPKS